jgi:hypothetical protein
MMVAPATYVSKCVDMQGIISSQIPTRDLHFRRLDLGAKVLYLTHKWGDISTSRPYMQHAVYYEDQHWMVHADGMHGSRAASSQPPLIYTPSTPCLSLCLRLCYELHDKDAVSTRFGHHGRDALSESLAERYSRISTSGRSWTFKLC